MTSRDRRRPHASATPRARRIQEAARREAELRAQGIDPDAVDRAYLESGEPSRRTRRRRPPLRVILLIGLLLVLVLGVLGALLLWQRVSAFNDSVSTAPATSSALWGPLGGDERINVVLFGFGGPEHTGGTYLADSIQILSIDPVTDTTTMIPIPRDLWIEGDPEIPDNAKINEAFAIGHARGGMEDAARLATKVLAEATGLKMHHVSEALAAARVATSLNEPLGDELELGDLVEDATSDNPVELVDRDFRNRRLQHAVEELPERERRIVEQHFGLGGEDARTLEEIGRGLGLTRERIARVYRGENPARLSIA